MKRIRLSFILLALSILCAQVSAQVRGRGVADTTTTLGQSSTVAGAPNNAVKSDEALVKEFTPYGPMEVVVIIPDVSFGEKRIDNLISAIKKDATVRQTSLYYKNRLAVITITQKNTATFDFWNSLPSDLQAVFPIKTSSAKSMLVTFDPQQRYTKNQAPASGGATRTTTDQTTTTTTQRRTLPVTTNPPAANSISKTNDATSTNTTQTKKNTSETFPTQQNNTSEERWADDPYTAALKKAKFGKEGAFIEFKKDGIVHQYNESMVNISFNNQLLGAQSGLAVEFMDLRKNAIIVLFVSGGDSKEILPGRYEFSGAREVYSDSEDAAKYPQAVFAFEQSPSRKDPPTSTGTAISLTTQTLRQNIVSGYVEFSVIEIAGKDTRVEGSFRFETKETKDRRGTLVPAIVITEGKFVAIPGGAPIIM